MGQNQTRPMLQIDLAAAGKAANKTQSGGGENKYNYWGNQVRAKSYTTVAKLFFPVAISASIWNQINWGC